VSWSFPRRWTTARDGLTVAFLLDTNVISEARKRAPNPNVRAWLASVPEADLYLSVLVVGEIRQGVERLRRRDPAQAEPYEAWLSALLGGFADRLVPVTADVCEEWGRLNIPDPLPVVDGLMAATAKVRGWTFVTRNVADVARTGVRLLDPSDPPG
jgi:predicted nucleic acid-binding protein